MNMNQKTELEIERRDDAEAAMDYAYAKAGYALAEATEVKL